MSPTGTAKGDPMAPSLRSERHTPGPWKVCGKDRASIAFSGSAGFTPIAWGNPEPLSDADMRLIAAAPEMLDTLDAMQWWINNPDNPRRWEMLSHLHTRIGTLLASLSAAKAPDHA